MTPFEKADLIAAEATVTAVPVLTIARRVPGSQAATVRGLDRN